MTTAPELPRGLEPWGAALAALTPALATALLPMIHALEELFGRRPSVLGDDGVPDGYDGITARGVPERILMSEWLLADEAPMEFLRRAASGELLHLAQARRRPRRAGRVVALVDSGPEQLGAPRLAQLAALIVLYRRAHAAGGELAVGLLGDRSGTWLPGDVGAVLSRWHAARSDRPAHAADVARWDAALEPGDEAWVLTGPDLARTLRRRRVAVIRAATWTAAGTATLHVDLDEDAVEVALPPRDIAVRALRGAGFRPAGAAVATAPVVRCPSFPSGSARLLLRAAGPAELLTVTVHHQRGQRAANPRRYSYRAPVVAAGVVSRRLVTLLADDDGMLRTHVTGKRLAWLDDLAVPFEAVDLDAAALAAADETLPPLHVRGTALLAPVGGRWFALNARGAHATGYVSVSAGPGNSAPLRVTGGPARLVVDDRLPVPGTNGLERVVTGGSDWVGVSDDGRTWRLYGRESQASPIVVAEGDEVLALVAVLGKPHLVTRAAAGLVLRLYDAHGARTLTRWSGDDERPAIHPVHPWIAVRRAAGVVEVGDFVTGQPLNVVRADA